MALNPPFVVRIEKSPESSFGAIMNDIRAWLDHRKIEPTSFKPVAKADRGVGFEIGFNTEDEAELFERNFSPRQLRLPPAASRGPPRYPTRLRSDHNRPRRFRVVPAIRGRVSCLLFAGAERPDPDSAWLSACQTNTPNRAQLHVR